MPNAVSYRAFAKRVGVSEKAIRKAAKAGGRLAPFLGPEGGITDVEAAARTWDETSRRPQPKTAGTPADPQTLPPTPWQTPGVSPDEPSTTGGATVIIAATLTEAQRLATIERMRKLRLENDVTQGRLVPVDAASKEAFDAERIVRESMLNIPARLAGPVAAETDPTRVQILLDTAIREALAATADRLIGLDPERAAV